jgi:hypothetical protein
MIGRLEEVKTTWAEEKKAIRRKKELNKVFIKTIISG